MDTVVGGATADSYVDLSFANSFFVNSIDNAAWPTTVPEQEQALIESTRLIDAQFNWYGDIASDTQSLRWPRLNTYDMDGRVISDTIIPTAIKNAVCNLTLFLLQNGGLKQSATDVKALKVGPVDIKFDSGESVIGIPRFIAKALSGYGEFNGCLQNSAYSIRATRA